MTRHLPESSDLLDWYDRNARAMPWRVPPAEQQAGTLPDPYAVWLSEVMLQQTTVAAVRDYFRRFVTIWPTVADLAAAEDADVMAEWAGLGYYARARNLLKCARAIVENHGGLFPQTREALLTLPGIGPYTASAIAAIAFNRPETVVDGNVERVMSRVFAVTTPLPAAKGELTDLAAGLTPETRPGDYAQAVMDLGATICTPKGPACGICPWMMSCAARAEGIASELPRKSPKKPKPTRHGIAWLARRSDGQWLLETRPPKGLLGGTLGWPTTDWNEASPSGQPPLAADWSDPGMEVRHTFTHFHLILTLQVAAVGRDAEPSRGSFQPMTPSSLPSLMRKAYDVASANLQLPSGHA